ncbi:PREDICTED: urotensin-2 [Chinchilla lanigera]|uniref:Urotensin-2 n=1 Tax=Chinchilla lanigera TaxID=34839 RepID=A0A8C2V7S9_CHILA|nr:PREDICTED: urotensin-2 [Chinchilla lanigera]
MYKLASCFLLFIGLLQPLFSLPVIGSTEAPLQLPAPDEEARLALEKLERAALLRLLPEVLGAGRGEGRKDTDPQANTLHPRGNVRKTSSGQEPNMRLSRLLASSRNQQRPHGVPLECFWKYCV